LSSPTCRKKAAWLQSWWLVLAAAAASAAVTPAEVREESDAARAPFAALSRPSAAFIDLTLAATTSLHRPRFE